MKLGSNGSAVVTGGGSGLGRELCLELGRRKQRLVVADLDLKKAESTCEDALRAGAVSAKATVCDVRKFSELQALEATCAGELGEVDLLVNNAGVAAAGLFEEQSIEDWHWLIETNLWGVIYGCHVFLPTMKKRKKGHILNIASAAGLVSVPRMTSYNVAKAGVVALSETLYGELVGTTVGITVACPTFFKTGLLQSARFTTDEAKVTANHLFDKSRSTAAGVASACIKAVEKNKLYVVPNLDGKVAWTAKRIAPRAFTRALSKIASKF